MALEDLTVLKELGFGIVSLLIIYILGKKVTDNAFKQIQEANERGEVSHKQFIDFMENAYKDNTKAFERFCDLFTDHLKAKETAISMLREQQDMLKDELHERRKQVPKDYRKSDY